MRAKKHSVGHKKAHAKTHRSKARTPVQIAREKWRLAVQRSREINRNWKSKLAAKTAEFKHKLDQLTHKAYQRAVETVSSDTRRRIEAKAKAIAAAEAKFEKKFSKLLTRKSKRRGKAKKHAHTLNVHASATHTPSTNKHVGKRRSRKSGKHHAVNTGHQTISKKRGRKSGRKSTLQVASHRMSSSQTKRRGRPAKRRAHSTVRSANHRANAR